MKKSLVKSLRDTIQGEIISEREIRRFYSVDSSSYQILPKLVVIAKNEEDVIKTVKLAKKFRTSITVRGAGTGLVGSALNSGIIIDLKNLNMIKIVKNHVTVGVGTLKGNLDKKLENKKKFFPPNPSIGAFCSIGGMLGNNSSGSRSLKYGSVIDNVIEIRMVNANGEIINLPENKKIANKVFMICQKINKEKFPKVSKNSSGYRIDSVKSLKQVHKVLIGSEGTLGIILSAKLKIKEIPKKRTLFIIECKSVNNAILNCIKIKKTNPSAIEFVDKHILKNIREEFNPSTNCLLFVEYDKKIDHEKIKRVIDGTLKRTIKEKSKIQQWWKYRDAALHYSLKSIKKEKRTPHIIEDAVVSIEKVEKIFHILEKINQRFETRTIIYGHIGNGNLHVRLITNEKQAKVIKKISKIYFKEIIQNRGSITAEHGDGLARSEYVKMQYGGENYQIFKNIKKFFDPKNIFNPGKIITNQN